MIQVEHMEWKQPEGFRRHWILDEMDGELLFLPLPLGAAQGRAGEELYDLRDGGSLRKQRTLAMGDTVLATLERKAAGTGGVLRYGEREYVWKPANPLETRWALHDIDGKGVFAFVLKPGLVKGARVEIQSVGTDNLGPLLLLCWYVTVL
ncbi:MAG: hypothetical protein ACKV2U_29175 [Bryobacteraceae bacterium]